MADRRRMYRKSSREEASERILRLAAAKASPGVVSIVSHDVPAEMGAELHEFVRIQPPPNEIIFFGCGIIIECQTSAANGVGNYYLCTVLAPACLFKRTDNIPLNQIKVDVLGESGELYRGKLLAYDFHYNLAAITINSKSPLQTVILKSIDDTLSIDLTQLRSLEDKTFRLPPHSNAFKIVPGTEIFSVWRSHIYPYTLYPAFGSFSSRCPKGFCCSELYEIRNGSYHPVYDGGPVLNSFGDVIGIIFNKSSFLPSNIITRWWNHYKSSGEICRPFLGMKVVNLHDTDIDFLAEFMTRFPDISTAIVVAKVVKDSPACSSGICTKDVILKLDGEVVKSKMQFFETIWEKAGKSVEFNILRKTTGKELNLSLVIEEASADKFHQWPYPCWKTL